MNAKSEYKKAYRLARLGQDAEIARANYANSFEYFAVKQIGQQAKNSLLHKRDVFAGHVRFNVRYYLHSRYRDLPNNAVGMGLARERYLYPRPCAYHAWPGESNWRANVARFDYLERLSIA